MKKQFTALSKLAALSVLAAFAAPAMAQQAGDNVVNVGWAHVSLNQSSELLSVNGNAIPGTGARVSNADTLLVDFSHFFTDNFAVTADMGVPPTFKLYGQGALLQGLGQIATAKQWSPALLGKYYFGEATSTFRPYLGGGVAYVWYSDIKLTNNLTQLLGLVAAGNPSASTSAKLSSSFVPIANVGFVYNINNNWSVNASLAYVKLSTKADLSTETPTGTVHSTTKITLDPLVSTLTVGYKF
ncbi:OmpW/AlkL family protein [Glaciimonas soli]|uniref:Outer membrane beta-barrel protein n=1 Tax=Glaciimonas soli TaxID=2590999 RepID=A0A843YTR0_9BURK|nr:OmpW family outer membrane protein [Glaciimonas soli]MQR00888.1 outer membrane beta-barrel protein [Glaciimonas soli]